MHNLLASKSINRTLYVLSIQIVLVNLILFFVTGIAAFIRIPNMYIQAQKSTIYTVISIDMQNISYDFDIVYYAYHTSHAIQ